jgi:hypothetical protein
MRLARDVMDLWPRDSPEANIECSTVTRKFHPRPTLSHEDYNQRVWKVMHVVRIFAPAQTWRISTAVERILVAGVNIVDWAPLATMTKEEQCSTQQHVPSAFTS